MNKMKYKKYIIICGHYGTGKTNFALNLAFKLSSENKKTVLVDLDIVNPYFVSSEHREELNKRNIDLIAPKMAGTGLDVPALSPKIDSVFSNTYDHVIFDAGGDDAGALALGRYSEKIKQNPYEMLYVINKYRNLIANSKDAQEILLEIEKASRLKATGIINNSHLCDSTTSEDVLNSIEYANEVSSLINLPVKYTTSSEDINIDNLFKIETIVKLPWAK